MIKAFDIYQTITEPFCMYCALEPVYLFIIDVITFKLPASSSGNKLKHFVSVLDVNKYQ